MARFQYVGDPNDNFSGPEVVDLYGYSFTKGEAVDVDDKETFTDPGGSQLKVADKLRGNSHFVDLSDREQANEVAEKLKALDKAEKDKAKAEAERQKRDEADEKQRQANLAKTAKTAKRGRPRKTAATAPQPPGKVTRPPVDDPFQGRTVEERTQAEDHTKAGKTKG